MFEPIDQPRVFACAPGVDFPAAILRGLESRLACHAPEAWARVTVLVNTRRMARRLRELFDAGPPRLLPQLRLISDVESLAPGVPLPPAPSSLKQRLELVTLISKLIKEQPELAARSASFALADSLATLFDEMQGEGVTPEDIARLDVSDQSGHWLRAQKFIGIAQAYINADSEALPAERRQRLTVLRLLAHWTENPLVDPILIIGSTGSRGTTQLLMQGVAALPQGAVVLPGFDFDMPANVWGDMPADHAGNGATSEDHPQSRFVKLIQSLDLSAADVKHWSDNVPPSPARNRLVSLALRPAPVTDAWRTDGQKLTDIGIATDDITLVEAESPRAEAIAIAMRLRQAAEDGQRAALITPDRMLTRQVAAALDLWGILPDDSAGTPLHLSPPGRFLRHVAELLAHQLDAEALLTLLKHPLTHSGGHRNAHQLDTQRLELQIRKDGLPYPDPDGIARCAQRAMPRAPDEISNWAEWVSHTLCGKEHLGSLPLVKWVSQHLELAEQLAAGPVAESESELWQKKAGQAARKVMDDFVDLASHGGEISGGEYVALITALLSDEEVRDRDAPHPSIMFWGTLEARVQGADLVILASLNEGTWPEAPRPDPWLNRKMRIQSGLLLPERRIGLSAHDFQQAIAAPEVWLTRSIRSDDAETVPSRWMNRLRNLMSGLIEQGGPQAWDGMKQRGNRWLELARALNDVSPVDKAHRPAPCPPVAARPRQFSVTEIKTLIRDPFAIFAKHCLRLRALRPLVQTPDALLRGILSHQVMEDFVKATVADPTSLNAAELLAHTAQVLEKDVPWPATRLLWMARFERAAEQIVAAEITRQSIAQPFAFEEDATGRLTLPAISTNLTARADRIDLDPAGDAILYDYKTGALPTKKEQKYFDKQLLIEAAMVEEGDLKKLAHEQFGLHNLSGLGPSWTRWMHRLTRSLPTKFWPNFWDCSARILSRIKGTRRVAQFERTGTKVTTTSLRALANGRSQKNL